LLGDFGFNDFRRRARVGRDDHDHREVDVRKLIDLQSLVRKKPKHHQRQHHHGGEDRVFETDAGKPHDRSSLFFLAAYWVFLTCVPSRSTPALPESTCVPAVRAWPWPSTATYQSVWLPANWPRS